MCGNVFKKNLENAACPLENDNWLSLKTYRPTKKVWIQKQEEAITSIHLIRIAIIFSSIFVITKKFE